MIGRTPYWGLVEQNGPWKARYGDYARSKDAGKAVSGPLGFGGTAHAGHADWKTVIAPVRITDTMGIAKPSTYALNSVVTKPVEFPHKQGIRGLRKLPYVVDRWKMPGNAGDPDAEGRQGEPDGTNDPDAPRDGDPNTAEPGEPPITPETVADVTQSDMTQLNASDSAMSSFSHMSKPQIDSALQHNYHVYHLPINKSSSFEGMAMDRRRKSIAEENVKTLEYHAQMQKFAKQDHKMEKKAFDLKKHPETESDMGYNDTKRLAESAPNNDLKRKHQLATLYSDMDTLKKGKLTRLGSHLMPSKQVLSRLDEETADDIHAVFKKHESSFKSEGDAMAKYISGNGTLRGIPSLDKNAPIAHRLALHMVHLHAFSNFDVTRRNANRSLAEYNRISTSEDKRQFYANFRERVDAMYESLENHLCAKIQDEIAPGADFKPPRKRIRVK